MPIRPKPSSCAACPAFDIGQSYVPGRGNTAATLVLLGQGPGKVEAYTGEPFRGPSGKILSRWLARADIPEDEVYFDNVVRCWLPKDRKPLAKEIAFCWKTHVKPALERMPNINVVCPVGVPAQTVFKIGKAGERQVGSTHTISKEIIYGTPAEAKPDPKPDPTRE